MTKFATIKSHLSSMEDEQQNAGGEPAEVTPGAVRFAAMNLLARREHSRLELQQKLSRRFSAPELIETVIQNLADEALQSDDRYAESFVSVRKGKGQGPIRIATELKMRGVDEAVVSRYLESDDQDWVELARSACLRKYRSIAHGAAEKAKQMRFLQYRGFTSEQIRQIWKSPE